MPFLNRNAKKYSKLQELDHFLTINIIVMTIHFQVIGRFQSTLIVAIYPFKLINIIVLPSR